MNEIVIKDQWPEEISRAKVEDFFKFKAETREEARLRILEMLDHGAWIPLGFASQTSFIKSLAAKEGKCLRSFYNLISGPPKQKELLEARNEENGAKVAPLSAISTGNTDNKIIDTEFVHQDRENETYPEHLQDIARLSKEVDSELEDIEKALSTLSVSLENIFIADHPIWHSFPRPTLKRNLNIIKGEIKKRRPWTWCRICGGDGGIDKGCTACHGRGWVNYTEWQTMKD